jgi:excinuclease ABC subunit A
VRKLLEVLHRLTDLGNSVIIIEHNLDVIRNADWILDLGPEGGEDGGRIVGEGRPAKIAKTPGSFTGEFLARYYSSHNGNLTEITSDVPVSKNDRHPERPTGVKGPAVAPSSSDPDDRHPERPKAKRKGAEGPAVAPSKKSSSKKPVRA